jgi:hypothetical protein
MNESKEEYLVLCNRIAVNITVNDVNRKAGDEDIAQYLETLRYAGLTLEALNRLGYEVKPRGME